MLSYKTTDLSRSVKRDGFYSILNETSNLFKEKSLDIFNKDALVDIYSDNALFADYKEGLCRGLNPDHVEAFSQLVDNTKINFLSESLGGITPISTYTGPVIRKLWPKLGLKEAIVTEVPQLPEFTLSYFLPYILVGGEKKYLPEAMVDGEATYDASIATDPILYNEEIKVVDFTPVGGAAPVDGLAKGFKLLDTLPGGVAASAALGDEIDRDFSITGINLKVTASGGATGTAWVKLPELITVDTYGNFFLEVVAYHADDLDVDGNPIAGATPTIEKVFGKVDFKKNTVTAAGATAQLEGIKVKGKLASTYQNHSQSVGFDIKKEEVAIGTGAHINAPLPFEYLQQTKALYNIDAAAKSIEIMTDVFAKNLDNQIKNFIVDNYNIAPEFASEFDCRPSTGFAGSPIEWRTVLQSQIDHLASKIKNKHYFEKGWFAIVGNEIDIALLPNISWTFTGNGAEISGVNANYKLGAVSGAYNYTILSSTSFAPGAIYMYYLSEADEELTYRYYPYSFFMDKDNNYADPQRSYVPNIMMTRSDKLMKFRNKVSAKIVITHNDGNFIY